MLAGSLDRVPDDETTPGADPQTGLEPVPWRVVLLAAGGMTLPHGAQLVLEGYGGDLGVIDIGLTTRLEDVGAPEPLARELLLEVNCWALGATDALTRATEATSGLAMLLAFAANAHVGMPVPCVAFESAPGLSRRRYWQGLVPMESGMPPVKRHLDAQLLFPFLQAVLTSTERERVVRAVGQYDIALQHWTVPTRPLALAHLYMALEALAPAVERVERARLGLSDERAHAEHRKVELERSNWKEVLLGWVRRDVICGGDKATYDTARKASDGFEHGSEDFASFRAAAEATSAALMGYVRRGVIDLLDLPETTRERLASASPLDGGAVRLALHGELTGAVQDPDRLGLDGQRYPHLEWDLALNEHQHTPGVSSRITPRVILTSPSLPEGATLTLTGHALSTGLTDPDLVMIDPSAGGPPVIPDQDLHHGGQ